MSVRLNSLLKLALKVSQSILRCGDGLIRGRVKMVRLLMCLMGKWISFNIFFQQYTAKYIEDIQFFC